MRLACFAAASAEDAGEVAGIPAAGVPAAGAPAIAGVIGNTQRHNAAARVKDLLLIAVRIAPTGESTDEARMKLA